MVERITLGKAQIQGQRKQQQDTLGSNCQEDDGIVPRGGVVAVVADGVGGHSHGKAASALAVRVFLQAYRAGPKHQAIPDALLSALHAANNAVCEFAKAQGALGNCGTTLTAAAVQPETRGLHWISVGDSRLYLLRGKQLAQITADSNYAGYLRKRTVLEAEASDPGDDEPEVELMALTSFLGKQELTEIDRSVRPFTLEAVDWLVLCTDGVYNALDAGELAGCLTGGPQEACDALLRLVMAKGLATQDNTTVAILAFRSRELPARRILPETPAKPPETPQALPKKPPSKRLLWLALATLAALSLALLASWQAYQKAVEPPPPQAAEPQAPKAVEPQAPKAAGPPSADKPRRGKPDRAARPAPPAARH